LFGGNGTRFRRRFPAQEIGQHGTRCNRCDATLGLEARGGDSAGLDSNSEPQDIAAHWICHFDHGSGAGKIARIVGFAEMLEHSFVEHGRQYKAERRTLNVRVRDSGVQYCTLLPNGFSLRFSFESD
jgi:hypothetical protein